ncbi:hypothetical protein C6Y39_09555 [Alteromonas gracilis]|uniref:Uncharacterized protein n=1 Tax=Alteromonas gracilis TaxID=1479524 RepID=A0ABX5CMN6_9ALTE|nr:hypothetical protein C6Y39_09555 [Alteromonas gracilis]
MDEIQQLIRWNRPKIQNFRYREKKKEWQLEAKPIFVEVIPIRIESLFIIMTQGLSEKLVA